MRPHVDGMIVWWRDWIRFFFTLALIRLKLAFHWYSRKHNTHIDGLTDLWTNRPSHRDVKMHIVNLLYFICHLFSQKYWFFLILTKASPTHGPTDRRTDRPSYRDARTHLISLVCYLYHLHSRTNDFCSFLQKRDQPTDRRTDGRTDPLTEMRVSI